MGDGAEVQKKLDPVNAICNAKRFIGKKWDDPTVQENISKYAFKIEEKNNKVQFVVNLDKKLQYFTPEEISGALLTQLKKSAEDYLEETIEDAVITVPAYFTDSQRKATKDAGLIAGLNAIRIINEPTAAAMAYGLQERSIIDEEKHILVYDFGGGTFDVSVLELEEDLLQVKATCGDSNLGGEDINTEIVRYFKKEIFRKYKVDITPDRKAVQRLRNACEMLKINLSAK